jgi:hypothetical protein
MASARRAQSVTQTWRNAMQTAELEPRLEAPRSSEQARSASRTPTREASVKTPAQRVDAAGRRFAPGGELHPKVYGSLLVSTVTFVVASWLAFGRDGETDYLLLIVGLVFFGFTILPVLIFLSARRAARAGGANTDQSLDQFMDSRVETGSGALTGRQAWLQIAIIPLCLAAAAILIGLASAVTS